MGAIILLGALIGQATTSHSSIRPPQAMKSISTPWTLIIQPPTAPPTKKPSDCSVLYTPSAAPRAWGGARREARLGWLAGFEHVEAAKKHQQQQAEQA